MAKHTVLIHLNVEVESEDNATNDRIIQDAKLEVLRKLEGRAVQWFVDNSDAEVID